jgi:hypothetical protein
MKFVLIALNIFWKSQKSGLKGATVAIFHIAMHYYCIRVVNLYNPDEVLLT